MSARFCGRIGENENAHAVATGVRIVCSFLILTVGQAPRTATIAADIAVSRAIIKKEGLYWTIWTPLFDRHRVLPFRPLDLALPESGGRELPGLP